MRRAWLGIFTTTVLLAAGPGDGIAREVLPGEPLPSLMEVDLHLSDLFGKPVALEELLGDNLTVVAFLGTECPLSKLYGQRLVELQQEYGPRGVTFVALDANEQDTLAEMTAFARRLGIEFPLIKDLSASGADFFGAKRNPEVFVLDAKRRLQYRGRIDDQYGVGVSRDHPESRDLCNALDALLAGRPVEVPATGAVGCFIGKRRTPSADSEITYANTVAELLQQHCVECHRPGEIGPFSLTEYDDAAAWAEMLEEVVRDERMPPWHANPEVGHYQGERIMTEQEKQLLYDWVQAGAPAGDLATAPPPPEFVEGWRLPREPDLVLPMRSEPFHVPAQGVIEYQYFAVDPGFTEDRWIQAADIAPGDRSVVHHVIVFVSPPPGKERRGLGWLTAYVPGQSGGSLPPTQARFVRAGSKLIFQMHYTPTGAEVEDQTKLALVFADPSEVEEEVVTLVAVNGKFEIPPHASDYRVDAEIDAFPPEGRLLGMAPHMHVRGRSFRFTARFPDGTRQVLLDVPHYDFNWQHNYRLIEPLATESGFAIECSATFDNSEKNPANPDPDASVRWGDQTFEEMMIAFFEVAVPRGSTVGRPPSELRVRRHDPAAEEAAAEALLVRFDANGDAELSRQELPEAFRLFAFGRYDADRDGRLSKSELLRFSTE